MSKALEAVLQGHQGYQSPNDYRTTGSRLLTAAERQIWNLAAGEQTIKEESIKNRSCTKGSEAESRTNITTHSPIKGRLIKLGLLIALLAAQATMSNTLKLFCKATKATKAQMTTAQQEDRLNLELPL